MEEDFDLDNMLVSMNLAGQWQPSSKAPAAEPSLNNQILDNVDLDLLLENMLPTPTDSSDDISSALIDPPINAADADDIGNLISTPIGEVPRQSTIEETLEQMNINLQTDVLSSSICIQMGSSPVEQKEIDNSILARPGAREQHRIHKNATKSRRPSAYQQASSKVRPTDMLSSYGACQPCTTVQMQSYYDETDDLLQFDTMEPKKIQILSQPRVQFRPRTQNESKYASHYLRCEPGSPFEYPTIAVSQTWARKALKNIIEVALVGIDGHPHPYTINNKLCKNTFEDDALIFRQNEPHTLYFCLTAEDIQAGYKSFMIEYLKGKQEGSITKDLIKNRQLEQSMLRFTRIYQVDKNTYERDESSVEYSRIMTEMYGDIAVEHMGAKYGPMCGNERVYALLKGRLFKDDITVSVTESNIGWHQEIPVTKNGSIVYFTMPAFPYPHLGRAVAMITIFYKREELHQSPFIYKGDIDVDLANLNLTDSNTVSSQSSTSNTFDPYEFLETGVCPVTSSMRKSSTTKTTKRLNKKQSKTNK